MPDNTSLDRWRSRHPRHVLTQSDSKIIHPKRTQPVSGDACAVDHRAQMNEIRKAYGSNVPCKANKSYSLPTGGSIITYRKLYRKHVSFDAPETHRVDLVHNVRKKELYQLFRLVAKVTVFCLRQTSVHVNRNNEFDEISPLMSSLHFHDNLSQDESPLFFDPQKFKSNRQMSVSEEVKRVLSKRPENRTDQERRHAQIALRNIKCFAQYPIRMQEKIVEVGHYEKFEARRIIVRQCQRAAAFYFILSGSVFIMVREKEIKLARLVAVMAKGQTFGELAIINKTRRQSTVVAKETVELLSIAIEDFHNIFMDGGVKSLHDPDQQQFFRDLSFLDGWPIGRMKENPKDCIFHYFRRGEILVKDSRYSDWIYIVKSGSLTVLSKLKRVEPGHHAVHHVGHQAGHHAGRRAGCGVHDGTGHRVGRRGKSCIIHGQGGQSGKLGIKRKRNKGVKETTERGKSQYIMSGTGLPPLRPFVSKCSQEGPDREKQSRSTVDKHCHKIQRLLETDEHVTETETKLASDSTSSDLNAAKMASLIVAGYAPGTFHIAGRTKLRKGIQRVNRDSSLPSISSRSLVEGCDPPVVTDLVTDNDGWNERKHFKPFNRPLASLIESSKLNLVRTTRLKGESCVTKPGMKCENRNVTVRGDKPARRKSRRELDEEELRNDLRGKQQNIRTIEDDFDSAYGLKKEERTEADEDPQFVQVATLTKGQSFGLSEMILGNQPSLSAVSNGAECIMVKKVYYLQNSPDWLIQRLKQQCRPYPTEEKMQQELEETVEWDVYRRQVLRDTLKNISLQKNVRVSHRLS